MRISSHFVPLSFMRNASIWRLCSKCLPPQSRSRGDRDRLCAASLGTSWTIWFGSNVAGIYGPQLAARVDPIDERRMGHELRLTDLAFDRRPMRSILCARSSADPIRYCIRPTIRARRGSGPRRGRAPRGSTDTAITCTCRALDAELVERDTQIRGDQRADVRAVGIQEGHQHGLAAIGARGTPAGRGSCADRSAGPGRAGKSKCSRRNRRRRPPAALRPAAPACPGRPAGKLSSPTSASSTTAGSATRSALRRGV